MDDMVKLLDAFPRQPLDFFGALRASTYDNQIRSWIERDVVGGKITVEHANMEELSARLIKQQNLPTFEPVDLRLEVGYFFENMHPCVLGH